MPVSNHCAVSALDRRVLGIRGPEGPETRPAFEEPEKNSRPARVSSALNDLWGKKPKEKKIWPAPGLEDGWTPPVLWGPAQSS